METIITISGGARHGKDTTGDLIRRELVGMKKRVVVLAFADYLKFIAGKYFGYKGDAHKDEPGQRELLQRLGSEVGRKYNEDVWVDVVKIFLDAFKDEFDVAIVTDARFSNECNMLKGTYNVINLKVIRRNFDNQLGDKKYHVSETALNFFEFDHVIDSDNLDELEKKVGMFVKKFVEMDKI